MDNYFRQKIDNSRVVRVADPRRKREAHAALVAGLILFVLGFGYAWMRYEMVWLGYRVEAARQQAAQLEQWNRGLELQQAALRSPARIYTLAQARLGMQSAAPGQVMALDLAPAPRGGAVPAMASLTRP